MSAFMGQHKIFIQFELLKQTGVKDLCFDMKFVAPKPGKRAILVTKLQGALPIKLVTCHINFLHSLTLTMQEYQNPVAAKYYDVMKYDAMTFNAMTYDVMTYDVMT